MEHNSLQKYLSNSYWIYQTYHSSQSSAAEAIVFKKKKEARKDFPQDVPKRQSPDY